MRHLLQRRVDPDLSGERTTTVRRIETPYFFATDRDVNNAPVRPRVPASEVSQSGGAPPTVTATMRMTTKIPMRRPSASNLSRAEATTDDAPDTPRKVAQPRQTLLMKSFQAVPTSKTCWFGPNRQYDPT